MLKGKSKNKKHSRLYENYDYEDVFNKIKATDEDVIESLRRAGRYTYMLKTIKSGDMVESEIYPLWKCRNDVPRRKRKESSQAQKNLNNKNARKTIIRYINANFTTNDLMLTLTYKDGYLPDVEEAKKDIGNYTRKLRRYFKKNNLGEFKYLYVIEFKNGPTKKIRIHHHIIISNMDRDIAEEMWEKGYSNSKKLKEDDFGLEGMARYIAKDIGGTRKWSHSKNLKKPIVTKCRTRLTKRKVEKMVKDPELYESIFSSLYKNYDYKDCKTMYSDISAGFYLYARLKRKEGVRKRE